MKRYVLLTLLLMSFSYAQTIKTFYPDGKLKSATFYKKGKKNGVEHIYYPDGATLKYAKNYEEGKLHGLQQIYRKDALLILEENYKEGKLDGKSRYYTGGLLNKEVLYKDGKLNGTYIEFYPSGLKKLEIIFEQDKVIEGHLYDEIGQGKSISNQKLQDLNLVAFIGSLLHVEP
ncbi:MAG: hypothetical protein JXQ76_08045 [Campylobacterales bacterium]|nr:hypothetical protein [Campylobacterales bacterium]